MPGTSKSLSAFAEGPRVYVDNTFNAQAGSLQLSLSLHFLTVQSLKVSQTWELRAFSGLSCTYAQPYTCEWPFRFPGICQVFQSPPWTAHSPTFPFKVFGQLLACPSYVNNCHWLFSTNALGLGLFAQRPLWVRWNKVPCKWNYLVIYQISQ